MNNLVAIGDLGSNSFHLSISKRIDGQYQAIDSLKEMIHFASGLDDNQYLNVDSQNRALGCLKKFGERLRGIPASQVRIVATNTFRVAKNIDQFLPQAEKILGFPIEIIGGHEEARLIYTGVLHSLPLTHNKILVIDIGGGSTEFIVGKDKHPEITESLHLGCVTFSQHFFKNHYITAKQFKAAINAARAKVQIIKDDIKRSRWKLAIGSSGTAKAIGSLAQNRQKYPSKIFDYDFLIAIKEEIIAAGSVEKIKKDIKSSRAPVFAGGLAIMIALFEELNIEQMQATDLGLRDGVLFEFTGRQLKKDLRDETVESFQKRYQVNLMQAQHVRQLALELFQRFHSPKLSEENIPWSRFIGWAADLHEIGLFMAHSGYHKHGAYVLANADMSGFSQLEQNLLSQICLGQRGNLKKMKEMCQKQELWRAVIVLRLAVIFCRAKNKIQLPQNTRLSYDKKNRKLVLNINQSWLDTNPLIQSMLEDEKIHWSSINQQLLIENS